MNKNSRLLLALLACASAHYCVGQNRYSITDEDASGPGSPRIVVLHDGTTGAEAAVTPSEGGELSSYKVSYKGQLVELLYHARDYSKGGFGGKGPIIWPAVGAQYPTDTVPKQSCGMGSYTVAGKSYPMPCHGFGRRMQWKEVSRAADNRSARVTVELTDSDETRKYYPFAFHLDANYELMGGHLTVDYVVKSDASNTEPMPFSIGNHIAFKLPFLPGTDPAKIQFETQNTIQLLRNTVGVLSGEQKPQSFATPQELGSFDAHVALPLAGYKSQPFARLIDPQGMTLRLTQTTSSAIPGRLIRFNAYGGPSAGYFCPEPWFGVQNSLNTGVGLVTLKPGTSWTWRLALAIERASPPDPAPDSGVKRVAGNFYHVEGPVWDKHGNLFFSDIENSRIMKIGPSGRAEVYREFTNASNGNSMDAQGRLYSCERDGHRVVRQEKDGKITVVASEYEGKKLNSPNDVVVRKDGQVYFSDPVSASVLEPQELGFSGLYHVTPQGKITLIAKLARPNGVALTPDGRTLYAVETGKIMAYDLDAAGNASNERTAINNAQADGFRVAVNGNLYLAGREVTIYKPDGTLIKSIPFPEMPANLAFGGPDMQTLYVTAQTSIYSVRVPDKGPPPF